MADHIKLPTIEPTEINLLVSKNITVHQVLTQSQDYNPHHHGNRNHPTLYWHTLFHLLKVMFGVGVLAMPFIFKNVGYVVAIVGMLLISTMYTHAAHMLLSVEYKLCKQLQMPNLTYASAVHHTFKVTPLRLQLLGVICKFLVYYQYLGHTMLLNSLFLLTIITNINTVIDHYCNVHLTISELASFVIIPIILLTWIPNLKYLAFASVIANLLNVVNFILIVFVPMSLGTGTLTNLKPIGDFEKFPQFVALALGAISVTAYMLPLKNDMKKPKQFSDPCGVFNVTILLGTITLAIFGTVGYLNYGEATKANIIQNLPTSELPTLMVLFLYAFVLCVSFTIVTFVALDTIWVNILRTKFQHSKHQGFIKCGVKTLHALVSYGVVMTISNFEIIISAIGTMRIIVEICIPSFLDILIRCSSSRKWDLKMKLIILKNGAVITLALLLFVFNVCTVMNRIKEFYKS